MMENNQIDVEANTDTKLSKQSTRAKKSKKFFDDTPSTKPVVKVRIKNISKEKAQKNLASDVDIGAKVSPSNERQEPTDDEAAWLEALEKGELDDNGDIPKTRDLSLMTARQRALMDRTPANLVEEISPAPTVVAETEDEKRKRIEKNMRRKLQAVKKAKETQKQTIRRLIEIPSTSKEKLKPSGTFNTGKSQPPMIVSVNNAKESTISYPKGFDYPLPKQNSPPSLPLARHCAVCGNTRKYDCSKTGAPLCSLACYKIGLKSSDAVAVT